MMKYKYNINNLDCAMCAKEIENKLNKDERFRDVIVNFNTGKLVFYSDMEFSLRELNNIVREVESDVSVSSVSDLSKREYHLYSLLIGVVLVLLGYFLDNSYVKYGLYIIGYIVLLHRCIVNSVKTIVKSKSVNENFLITVSCFGALYLGNVMEGVMVIALYTVGKVLEEKALNNSKKSINDLISFSVKKVSVESSDGVTLKDVEDVNVGDIFIVKKGEKVGVDAVVTSGKSIVDDSILTGESLGKEVTVRDKVLSGSINLGNVLKLRAEKVYYDSTSAKIMELIEEATDKKTKTETVISKGSKVYTPVVFLISVLILCVLPLFGVEWEVALYRSLTFLVISCPCAIAISVPLSYFTAIGVSCKNGILIKGSNYLDALTMARNIIFDKTGTLTDQVVSVKKIVFSSDLGKYSKREVEDILIMGEEMTLHPIGKGIVKYFNRVVDTSCVKEFKEITGQGISFMIDNDKVEIGKTRSKSDATFEMYINEILLCSVYLGSGVKSNAREVISYLKENGFRTYMFTGDRKSISLEVKEKLGIQEVKYEMLPTDKYNEYEKIEESGLSVFVGDGINDCPVLKRSSVGISMGSVGSDEAIESSDIVIVNDDLDKIGMCLEIGKYTKKIINENLVFALGIKVVILMLSIFGYANMFMAVFADTGVTLLTIFNTFGQM